MFWFRQPPDLAKNRDFFLSQATEKHRVSLPIRELKRFTIYVSGKFVLPFSCPSTSWGGWKGSIPEMPGPAWRIKPSSWISDWERT